MIHIHTPPVEGQYEATCCYMTRIRDMALNHNNQQWQDNKEDLYYIRVYILQHNLILPTLVRNSPISSSRRRKPRNGRDITTDIRITAPSAAA